MTFLRKSTTNHSKLGVQFFKTLSLVQVGFFEIKTDLVDVVLVLQQAEGGKEPERGRIEYDENEEMRMRRMRKSAMRMRKTDLLLLSSETVILPDQDRFTS